LILQRIIEKLSRKSIPLPPLEALKGDFGLGEVGKLAYRTESKWPASIFGSGPFAFDGLG
jgi:hypothetical protein